MQAASNKAVASRNCPKSAATMPRAASAQRRHQATPGGLAKAQKDGQPPGVEAPHRQDREPPGSEEQVALVQPVRYLRLCAGHSQMDGLELVHQQRKQETDGGSNDELHPRLDLGSRR